MRLWNGSHSNLKGATYGLSSNFGKGNRQELPKLLHLYAWRCFVSSTKIPASQGILILKRHSRKIYLEIQSERGEFFTRPRYSWKPGINNKIARFHSTALIIKQQLMQIDNNNFKLKIVWQTYSQNSSFSKEDRDAIIITRILLVTCCFNLLFMYFFHCKFNFSIL